MTEAEMRRRIVELKNCVLEARECLNIAIQEATRSSSMPYAAWGAIDSTRRTLEQEAQRIFEERQKAKA